MDLQIENISLAPADSDFSVRRCGTEIGEFHLSVPGLHNVLNATAAIGVGLEMDVPVPQDSGRARGVLAESTGGFQFAA